jgi:hypothetical protein
MNPEEPLLGVPQDALFKALLESQINETNSYYEWVGRFIDRFSFVENCLFVLFITQTNISFQLGRALFSGYRTETITSQLSRVWEVNPPPIEIKEELEMCFKQLQEINKLRNTLVHNGTDSTPDGRRQSSTALRELRPENIFTISVSTEMLIKATKDLSKISGHMISTFKMPILSKQERAKENPEILSSWQYIPPPDPRQTRKKPKKTHRKKV